MTDTAPAARPQPVRNAAAVASAATSLSGLVLLILVVAHVLTPEGSAILGPAIATAIPTVIGAASTILAALHARTKVTPLSAPILDAGAQLLDTGQQLATAVRQATRPAGPQTPGIADHAAPDPVPLP